MKRIVFSLLLILLTIVLSAQVPTPNPANNTFYCPNTTKVYGDQPIDPLANYSFNTIPAVPFTVISGGDQIQVNWTTPGVYTVEVTKTIGSCFSVSTAIITIYPPTIPALPSLTVCQGNDTATLTAIPIGSNPVFSGTGVTGTVFSATGLAPGTYNVSFTSTDANGCPMSGTGTVTVIASPPSPNIFTN
jgi:hypothetical protein